MSNPEIFNFADAKKNDQASRLGRCGLQGFDHPPHPRGIKGKLPDNAAFFRSFLRVEEKMRRNEEWRGVQVGKVRHITRCNPHSTV